MIDFPRLAGLQNLLMGYTLVCTRLIAATAINCVLLGTAAAQGDKYIVLCYHSVPERYNGDPMAVSAANLAEQLAWLRAQGYTPITVSQVLQAQVGKAALPAKSFLLTVDDGYEDFYKNIFPVLQLYKVPAVFSLVGKWTETGRPMKNETDPYFKNQRFADWPQIREMQRSGLVEIASHSYDLHHGIPANPQGNTQPAAVSLQYHKSTARYETIAQRRARIRADLTRNSALIASKLGKRPRVMVWPYGAYDRVGVEEAARAGMPINFILGDGLASALDPELVPRVLVGKEMPLSTFSYLVQSAYLRKNPEPLHAIKVNLDRLYDDDAEKQNQKLGELIERVRELGLNAVVLQPFVSPARAGSIEQVYFPNSILPMRADLLNRVSWQLFNRLGVGVYMSIPVSHYAVRDKNQPRRLDLANARDRAKLLKLYEDFSSHTPLRGLIFMDSDTTPGHLVFTREVLERISYYRPLARSVDIGETVDIDPDFQGTEKSKAPGFRYPLAVFNAPLDMRADAIAGVRKRLPKDVIPWALLPTADLNSHGLPSLIYSIRALQRAGINNFLLDDDGFLDDKSTLNSLRSVVSLKRNPYLHVGQ